MTLAPVRALRSITTPSNIISTFNKRAMSTSNATTAAAQHSRTVVKSVYAVETAEGAGATVRRSIGTAALRNLSPFLMLDNFTVNPGAGFPDHPHRGMSTVTYMTGGSNRHEDFMGNAGLLETGDVQWMTAGRGIVHAEMPSFDEDPAKVEPAVGIQLWVDLPAKDKMCEPTYQEKKAKDIDTIHPQDGVSVTIISGESHGTTGFVRPVGGCWFFDYKLSKPGVEVFQPLPEGWTGFVYLIKGALQIDSDPTIHPKFHTLVLSTQPGQTGVRLRRPDHLDAPEDTHFILVAGEPLDQPVVQYGPFVVTSERQVREAVMDYRTGKNGFERAVGWQSEIGQAMRG